MVQDKADMEDKADKMGGRRPIKMDLQLNRKLFRLQRAVITVQSADHAGVSSFLGDNKHGTNQFPPLAIF